MGKVKKLFTSVRIIVLLVALILAVVAIHPNFGNKGVAIRNVEANSSASLAGIQNPKPTMPPMAREVVTLINNKPVEDIVDYYDIVGKLKVNQTVQIKTTKGFYTLRTKEAFETIELNGTVTKTVEETIQENRTVNGTSMLVNKTIKKKIKVPRTKQVSLGIEDIGLSIYNAPFTNIRKGLDLQGGTRVLLQPEKKLSEYDLNILLDNMKERLNVYGLSDLIIRDTRDLEGNQFIIVEIAGATEKEVHSLLAKQGKFEAKVGNTTVFSGGQDITFVCRSPECSGIDPNVGCSESNGQWFCGFRFSISLRKQAAERQAEATKSLEIVTSPTGGSYLSEPLVLILDNVPVDELNIGSDLKGSAVTDIEISGGGSGNSRQEAVLVTLNNMKRLQTIMITGSLPIKLDITKVDTISPVLGDAFLREALLVALLAIGAVVIILSLVYRNFKITVPIMITLLVEIVLLLGLASLIGWNIGLVAIAGIIVAVGTGVDDQIVITDEILRGTKGTIYNWKERMKKAFFIILAAYATLMVAMLPLLFAGAGLLKGFAIITMLGVTIGVLITRPAYAKMIEILLKD